MEYDVCVMRSEEGNFFSIFSVGWDDEDDEGCN